MIGGIQFIYSSCSNSRFLEKNKHIFPQLIKALCVLKANSPADNGLICGQWEKSTHAVFQCGQIFYKVT